VRGTVQSKSPRTSSANVTAEPQSEFGERVGVGDGKVRNAPIARADSLCLCFCLRLRGMNQTVGDTDGGDTANLTLVSVNESVE